MSECDPNIAAAVHVLDAAYHFEGRNRGSTALESQDWSVLKQQLMALAKTSEPPLEHKMLWIKWYRFVNWTTSPLSITQAINAWEAKRLNNKNEHGTC